MDKSSEEKILSRAYFNSKWFYIVYLLFEFSLMNTLFFNHKDTFTREIKTGTSTRGPITAAKASPELIPNTATATAMASSKLLLAAVKEMLAVLE